MSPVAKRGEGLWVLTFTCERCHRLVEVESDFEPTPLGLAMSECFKVCSACAELEDAQALEVEQATKFEARWEASRMPAAAKGLRFDDMIRSGSRAPAIDAAVAWARDEDAKGLLLHGPAGTGKTRLAATAALERLRRWPIRWVSVAMLIAQVQASFTDKDRAEALKVLTGSDALVLDDFDKVNPSESVKSNLFVAIDNRVTAGAPLLVTTNLPPSELAKKFGDPIVSRLAGHSLGRVFEMDGADRRLQLGEQAA